MYTDLVTTMLRVSDDTKGRIQKIAVEDFRGASVEETLRRLLDVYWESKAIAAMDRFREENPEGWRQYLADADAMDRSSAPRVDQWTDR
jgi:hypothetical protein